ncbi:MAG: SIS domain-containing protein [Chloroflexi bacterium]|nr:SIS domain-containing protein [Chloroflexota bacterium]
MHHVDVPRLDADTTTYDATTYLEELSQVLLRVPGEQLARATATLLGAREAGRRVYVFGNGGSAATASHFVCDLVKTAQVPGFRPFRAFALADNTPLMTAWSNDSAYADTFPRLLEALVEPGDVVVGISASGNSPNVVRGLTTAGRLGARTIALLGFDGGAALNLAEIPIHIPCRHYGLAEDVHSAIGHALTAVIRSALEREHRDNVSRLLDDAIPSLDVE